MEAARSSVNTNWTMFFKVLNEFKKRVVCYILPDWIGSLSAIATCAHSPLQPCRTIISLQSTGVWQTAQLWRQLHLLANGLAGKTPLQGYLPPPAVCNQLSNRVHASTDTNCAVHYALRMRMICGKANCNQTGKMVPTCSFKVQVPFPPFSLTSMHCKWI